MPCFLLDACIGLYMSSFIGQSMLIIENNDHEADKKLSYRRGTAPCAVSVEILPIAMQQCRNYLYDKS